MNCILRTAIFAAFSSIYLSGCTQSLPLISHAHVGHTLTAWRDTPNKQGLFVVAEKETVIALEQAGKAVRHSDTPDIAGRHLSNVIHALDPVKRQSGDGHGYGAIRALEGAVDHLVFAAGSDDASANMAVLADNFSAGAASVIERLKLKPENVCYIGDDLPDLAVIQHVGLGVAVADAVPEVAAAANFKTKLPGGRGAVRELVEMLLVLNQAEPGQVIEVFDIAEYDILLQTFQQREQLRKGDR